MNKNIVIVIGFILIAIIGYQAYLLDKSSDTPKFATKKEQPQITVNIEKETKIADKPIKQTQFNPDEMFDEELIKEDLNRLFKNIFGNPKLQEGIKEGLKEAEQQLQTGIKEMEKGFGDLSLELEKLSKNDPFFKDLLNTLKDKNQLEFTDRDKDYYLSLEIAGGANSKIDIKTKNGFLTILVFQNLETIKQLGDSTIKSKSIKEHKNTLKIPSDALIDKLKTEYNNNTLEIIIPKH